ELTAARTPGEELVHGEVGLVRVVVDVSGNTPGDMGGGHRGARGVGVLVIEVGAQDTDAGAGEIDRIAVVTEGGQLIIHAHRCAAGVGGQREATGSPVIIGVCRDGQD